MNDSKDFNSSFTDFNAVPETRSGQAVPSAIHALNLIGIVAWAVIVVPAAVVQRYQLAILVPVFVALIGLYWFARRKRGVAAAFLGLTMTVPAWITFCENIATIDNIFGYQIASKLHLDLKLQTILEAKIKGGGQHFRPCCGDPLTYNREPGSDHRSMYNCPDCTKPYEIVADETGFLNRQVGFYRSNDRIDLFLAGDSVMQGYGMASVLEYVRDRIPLKMWNLSVNGYGPRQKVSSLIAYALPKHPQWLILDFFSGNDVQDAIETRMCIEEEDYHCLYNTPYLRRQLLSDRIFGAMMSHKPEWIETFHDFTTSNFTLAMTRHVIDNLKRFVKNQLVFSESGEKSSASKGSDKYVPWPWKSNYEELKQERMVEWFRAGLTITLEQYDRLNNEISRREPKPRVILLYNPSGYEIYRGILTDKGSQRDELSALMVQTLQDYSEKHDWIFLDFTGPLRAEIEKQNHAWIYSRYDRTHWSQEGTLLTGKVLTAELRRILAH